MSFINRLFTTMDFGRWFSVESDPLLDEFNGLAQFSASFAEWDSYVESPHDLVPEAAQSYPPEMRARIVDDIDRLLPRLAELRDWFEGRLNFCFESDDEARQFLMDVRRRLVDIQSAEA